MKLGKQSVFYNAFFLCLSSIGLQLIGFVYRIGLSRFGGAEVMGMYQLIMPGRFSHHVLYHVRIDPGSVSSVCPISSRRGQRWRKRSCPFFSAGIPLPVWLCCSSGLSVSRFDCLRCTRGAQNQSGAAFIASMPVFNGI